MRILHVEDEPLDADLIRRRLADFAPHFDLEQVATYDSALARLDQLSAEPPDLVLTDMRLPDGDGLSLLVHIRERALPSAVVVVTGSGDDETVVAALKAGADDYVVKRDDYLERLPLALESALHRRRADVARHARPLKVLYAEHDPADIEFTRRHFARHAGHIHLHVVSTAAETRLRLLQPNGQDEYHVVLLDYSLPGLDALEVLKELQMTRGLGAPVILITGRGDEELALQALRLGASSYLVKNPGYLYKLPVELENAHVRAELTRREKALRESEEQRRLAQRAARVGTWEWDIETGASVWSELIWELLGLEPDDRKTTVERFKESIHPEDRDRVWRKVNEVIADGEEYYDEFRLVRGNGEVLWVCSKGRVARSASGRPERMLGVNIDITESKRAEEALRESEERNRAILEAVPDLMFLQSRDGVYLDFHAQDVGDLYALPEQFVGKKVDEVLPAELAATFRACFERALATGETQVHEYALRMTDGVRWYEARIAPCTDDRLLSLVRDITERRRAEAALKKSENQVRLFVEHTPVAVAMFDREMRYLLTSRRWLKDNSLGEQKLIGRCHYDVVPDIPERWREGHRRCMAGAIERREEDIFEHPDGTFDWVRWEIRPWHAADGEIGGIIMFSETITERKRAEQALLESNEELTIINEEMRLTTEELASKKRELQAVNDELKARVNEITQANSDIQNLMASTDIGTIFLDRQLHIKLYTPQVRGLFNLLPHDLNRPLADITHKLDYDDILTDARHVLKHLGQIEREVLSREGRCYIARLLPYRTQEGQVAGVVITFVDITERKRAEEELVRLTVRLFTLQDEERRRIARELHDGTAQNLFALTFNLARLQQHAAARDAELQQIVADTMTLGEESLRDIRTLSYLLHPPLLDQAGLVSALRWYVKGFIKRSGIHVDLIVLQEIGRLPPEVETALFRIVQESLTNVHRHSGSAAAAVRLEMRQGEIVLQVKDEGRGMPPLESLGPADDALSLGVGLPGMRQRMRQLGGRLEFASGETGTTVTAIVPFNEGGDLDPHPAG